MVNDPESALYKELANIRELKKEVTSLKTKQGKLTSQVEQLKLMDFQQQINRLNKTITNLGDELLETSRLLAERDIEDLHDKLENVIAKTPSSFQKEAHDFLLVESASAIQSLGTSLTPLTIANEFRERCTKYFEENDPYRK